MDCVVSYFERVTLSFEFCTHGNRSLRIEKIAINSKSKYFKFFEAVAWQFCNEKTYAPQWCELGYFVMHVGNQEI